MCIWGGGVVCVGVGVYAETWRKKKEIKNPRMYILAK